MIITDEIVKCLSNHCCCCLLFVVLRDSLYVPSPDGGCKRRLEQVAVTDVLLSDDLKYEPLDLIGMV